MKLEIKNKKGDSLNTLVSWEKGFKAVDEPRHWEPGFSAHSLGLFFTSGKGEEWLDGLSRSLFGETIRWENAQIEHESKLDFYSGRHRMQDLALWGQTSKGSKVFVGVEAKVLESFGNYSLRDEYENALQYQKFKNKNSKKPARVAEITSFLFPGCTPYDEGICNLRYQLMYFFTASIKEASTYLDSIAPLKRRKERVDIVVLPVLAFKTDHYYPDENKAKLNESDYLSFCEALKLEKSPINGKDVWTGSIDGRIIYTLYEKIDL